MASVVKPAQRDPGRGSPARAKLVTVDARAYADLDDHIHTVLIGL